MTGQVKTEIKVKKEEEVKLRFRLSLRRREKRPKGVTVSGSSFSSFFTSASTLAFVFILIFLFYTLYATRYTLDVFAGVATTRHNLSVNGPGTIKAASGQTTEICVFCHTPHGAIDTGDAPLWNHRLSTVANYIVPSDSYMTVGQPDKGSKLCLSCHDGTVAIGAVVNTPGPGSTGQITMAGGITTMPSTNGGYLGTDISGMHPVSIAVNCDLKTSIENSGTGESLNIPPLLPLLKPTNATYGGNLGVPIRGGYGGVQCASCHDPHNDHPENGNCSCFNPSAPNAPCFWIAKACDDTLCSACHVTSCTPGVDCPSCPR